MAKKVKAPKKAKPYKTYARFKPVKKPAKPVGRIPLAPNVLGRPNARKPPKAPNRSRSITAPTIGTPSTQAPTPEIPMIIPASARSQDRRIAADASLAAASGNRNSGVYQAALNYGDPAVVAQWANLGYGAPISENPTSALSLIAKDEAAGLKTVDEGHNTQNTFFSGLRLGDVSKTRDSATAARAKAYQDYMEAVSRLDDMLAEAQSERDNAYFEADEQDWNEYMATHPEAIGDDYTEPASAATGGGGKKKKKSPRPVPRSGHEQKRGGDDRRKVKKPKKKR